MARSYITLTAQNIKLIAARLEAFGSFSHYQYYPSSAKSNAFFKRNGIDSYSCEKSKPTTFGGFGSRIDVDYMHGRHFIRVVYNSQNAGIIYVGAKIRLTSNRMYVRDTADKCWPHYPCEAHPVQVFQKG